MGCIGKTGQALIDCRKGLRFTLLGQARQANNIRNNVDITTPATKRDSTQYRKGFSLGLRGLKPSKQRLKYEGEPEMEKMGRWEGQNSPLRKKKGKK